MVQLSTFAVAASIAGAGALNLVQRDDGVAPKVIQGDIQRRVVENPIARDRLRRRATKTIQESLANEETLYFANVTMGTPSQSLRLHLDTGSSDLWVNVRTLNSANQEATHVASQEPTRQTSLPHMHMSTASLISPMSMDPDLPATTPQTPFPLVA